MATAGQEFLELLHTAVSGGRETTIREMCGFVRFESDNYLDQLQELDLLLKQYRLALRPPMNLGSDEDVRLLVYGNEKVGFEDRLKNLLGQGELVDVEYKSTAYVAVREVRDGGLSPRDAVSEGVLHSLLKTICGFLNKDGGEIYVGVEPTGAICGIAMDCETFPNGRQDFDEWSNRLMDQVRSRFHESRLVENYIDLDVDNVGGCPVVRITVRPRERVSFLKKDNSYRCYVRQNVRVEEVRTEELPDFLEARRLRRLERG